MNGWRRLEVGGNVTRPPSERQATCLIRFWIKSYNSNTEDKATVPTPVTAVDVPDQNSRDPASNQSSL
jgi:hypothetical protein